MLRQNQICPIFHEVDFVRIYESVLYALCPASWVISHCVNPRSEARSLWESRLPCLIAGLAKIMIRLRRASGARHAPHLSIRISRRCQMSFLQKCYEALEIWRPINQCNHIELELLLVFLIFSRYPFLVWIVLWNFWHGKYYITHTAEVLSGCLPVSEQDMRHVTWKLKEGENEMRQFETGWEWAKPCPGVSWGQVHWWGSRRQGFTIVQVIWGLLGGRGTSVNSSFQWGFM